MMVEFAIIEKMQYGWVYHNWKQNKQIGLDSEGFNAVYSTFSTSTRRSLKYEMAECSVF